MKGSTRKTQAWMKDNIKIYFKETEWRGIAA